ncbi:hypothetical protein EXIGLDRAFT_792787 [Exidia glandulosa HHB12029]|uniref:Uncharacterized protein n=1 Tax=Exidia glandulosa HHB12029 TaxID=1314781 RepID=A0A165GY28_EXIGL|nr:hypothetical protein EXIGLDRAFT_792787 [Exidia glandulosa HHB12029]
MKIQVLLFFSSLALFAVAQDAVPLTQADVDAAKAKMDDLCTGDTWNATTTELRGQFDQLKADKKAIEDMVDGGGADEEQDDPAHDDAVFKKWVQKDGTYNSAVAACKGAKINFYATQDGEATGHANYVHYVAG